MTTTATADDPAVKLAPAYGKYQLPLFTPKDPVDRAKWLEAKTQELFDKCGIEDRDIALDTASVCAEAMFMYGLAFERILLTESPSPADLRTVASLQSKIPRLLKALGLLTLYREPKNAGGKASTDPYGDD